MVIARIENVLRRNYVRFRNRRLLRRYVLAQFSLVGGLLRTLVAGLWNAERLSGGATGAVSIFHMALGSEVDHVRFLVRVAERSAGARSAAQRALNVVLVLPAKCQPAPYATIARLFPGRVNLHMAWNEHTGEKLRQAVVDADGARKAKSFSADRQPVDFTTFVDALKPRPFYSNGAREFLKTIDWSCRYVAVSSSALLTWSNLLETLADVDLASQGWRAVLLGRPPEQGWQSLPERVTAASHAGLDLAMQLALAVEADAFVGPIDKFAIVAALAGKPAAIVSSNDAIAEQLKVLPNVLLESSSTTPLVAVTSLLLSVKDRAQI